MTRILLLLGVVLVFISGVARAESLGPTDTLRPVLDNVTAVLVDESLKGDEHLVVRRQKIMTLVKQGFDFKEMSKRVLGKTWKRISEEQRNEFTELLTKLLENVYIGKLEGYSGQSVEYIGEKIKGSRAQVTTFVDNHGAKIPVHYIMKKQSGGWMVYDINIEGVSLVRNYQQQFKSILRKEKFEGLVRVLEEKNNSFTQE